VKRQRAGAHECGKEIMIKRRFGFYGLMMILCAAPVITGCKTLEALRVEKCADPFDYYRMELWDGDKFNIALESRVNLKTPRGAMVDVPVDNISVMMFGKDGAADIFLCDGNHVSGEILNRTLRLRLGVTGKLENIPVGKIERLMNVRKGPPPAPSQ